MRFIGRSEHVSQCAFSKRLIVNGKDSKDIFASLCHILKHIVFHELSDNGNLDLSEIQENDLLMLKERMLEYGIDLCIEKHEGRFFPDKIVPESRLTDHLIILSFESGYVKIYFDYAVLSPQPCHLE